MKLSRRVQLSLSKEYVSYIRKKYNSRCFRSLNDLPLVKFHAMDHIRVGFGYFYALRNFSMK